MMASTPELMIIVMGATGAGKSTFLKLLTGNEEIRTSHSRCCTERVEAYKARVDLNGTARMVTFVDTPGFDDGREGHDDFSILKNIALWLGRGYQDKIKVAGVIYLQRITDERQTGTMRRSLKVLQKLIGEDKLAIAHMVTNRWEVVEVSGDQEKADERERMLLGDEGYWSPWFGAHGAGYSRHNNTYGSAIAIIQRILQNPPAYIKVQTEIVDNGLALKDTSAGKVVRHGLKQMLQEYNKEIVAVEKELEDGVVPALQKELKKLQQWAKFLTGRKQKLEMEGNSILMESIKMLGSATICGIVIGAGGAAAIATGAVVAPALAAGGAAVGSALAAGGAAVGSALAAGGAAVGPALAAGGAAVGSALAAGSAAVGSALAAGGAAAGSALAAGGAAAASALATDGAVTVAVGALGGVASLSLYSKRN